MARWVPTICFLAVFALGVSSRPISAQTFQKETLKGITAVYVLVENLPDGAKALGLSADIIRTDVELKLRLAGLRVVTEEEQLKLAGKPYLYVQVSMTKRPEAAATIISLNQDATLERNGQLAIGIATWENNGIIANPSPQAIRDQLKDLTDLFLNDWLAVNPKK